MDNCNSHSYLACPDCDALFTAPQIPEGDRSICPRCRAHLQTNRASFISHASALVIAAAFFFLLANLYPLLSMRADYRESDMRLISAITGLQRQGLPLLASMVATFVLGAPIIVIGTLLYVLLPLMRGRRLPWARHLCRAMQEARRWNMVEVFLLGILVSLLKLEKLATLTLGISFWAFVGFILCLASAVTIIDSTQLWQKIEEAQP